MGGETNEERERGNNVRRSEAKDEKRTEKGKRKGRKGREKEKREKAMKKGERTGRKGGTKEVRGRNGTVQRKEGDKERGNRCTNE